MKTTHFFLKILSFFILSLSFPLTVSAEEVLIKAHHSITYQVHDKHAAVVDAALNMLSSDLRASLGSSLTLQKSKAKIEIYQLDMLSDREFTQLQKRGLPIQQIIAKDDAYFISYKNKRLIICGSNGRGTAYGILELSRMAGVSAWTWWQDAPIVPQTQLTIDENLEIVGWASVKYRGISLEQTNCGLNIWSQSVDGHVKRGTIGGNTYEKLMQLMLRLHLNLLWPSQENGDVSFFNNKACKKLSEQYDIFVGVSPKRAFVWYGAEKKRSKTFKKQAGVLTWQDDGFGYMAPVGSATQDGLALLHLNDKSSGNLLFPYLSPGLIVEELQRLYAVGTHDTWVAVLNNPKTASYLLQLYADLAWNNECVQPSKTVEHLQAWTTLLFGEENAQTATELLAEYYRMTSICRPELLGWWDNATYDNQGLGETEFDASTYGNELERYLHEYAQLERKAMQAKSQMQSSVHNAFDAVVRLPISFASTIAEKRLQAQEAMHLSRPQSFHHDEEALESAVRSWNAYNKLKTLRHEYESLAGNKWGNILSGEPLTKTVFAEPQLPDALTEDEIATYSNLEEDPCELRLEGSIAFNAKRFDTATEAPTICEMLGHSGAAVALQKDDVLNYTCYTSRRGDFAVRLAFIPIRTTDEDVQVSVRIGYSQPVILTISTRESAQQHFTSAARGQRVISFQKYLSYGKQSIEIKALTDNVIIDQILIDSDLNRRFYRFPIK